MGKIYKKLEHPIIDIGNINYKSISKRKVINKANKQLKVVKVNGKTQYYSAYLDLNKSKLLQFSVYGKKIYKEYPEIKNFISKNIFFSDKIKKYTFNNKKLKLNLSSFLSSGLNNIGVYKLSAFFKKENINKDFFIKITNNKFLANNEFIANQAFQKYGFNVIKPHFAFTDKSKNKSIIIYDFTNLHTLDYAYSNKFIDYEQYLKIKIKINKLYNDKNLSTVKGYYKKGIGDFDRDTNIFIKKENNQIKLYFTDLLIDNQVRSY